MLSEKTIATVKAISPAVAGHAESITRRFYERMFEENPEVRAYFNQSHQHSGGQQKALAGAICAYFAHIDNPAALAPAIELIAQKHCSLGIQAEHYPIVGKHLLAAIQDVMGDAVNEDVQTAVAEAYELLADVCIERESEIYKRQRDATGGWNGYRPLTVSRKVVESCEVTSFYLEPSDGQPLPAFLPGQYITVRTDPIRTPTSPRNYSLSDRPGAGHFRISVKREGPLAQGAPEGMVSSFLHDCVQPGDQIEVGPPCGEFTLDPATVGNRPLVFLAAGVGVTPLLSMLKSLLHANSPAPIYFLQAARNSEAHAFAGEVRDLVAGRPHTESLVVYDQPFADDIAKQRCGRTGFVDKRLLDEWAPVATADFYFCGPRLFMQSVCSSLTRLGVEADRMHYEFFGPRGDLHSDTGYESDRRLEREAVA